MSESARTPVATGSALVFRPTNVERRAPAIATAAFASLAILLGIVAVVRRDGAGNFTVYAIVTGCLALLMLFVTVAGRRFFTECGPDGIRTRRWRLHHCSWSDVADIRERSVSGRGTTAYSVVVTTKAGKRFTLGAPNSSSSSRNPLFDQQLTQITAYWHGAASTT